MKIYSFIVSVLALVLLSGSEISLQAQTVNIAVGKPATQSSNYNPTQGLASKAVDGNTDGTFFNGSVTHTAEGSAGGTANPWWEVDLGKNYEINRVVIYNRTDCCQNRLDNFQIWVRESNATTWKSFGVKGYYSPGDPQATSYRDNQAGRYVRIQIATQRGILSLAEVQVFGTERNITTPTPQPTPVRPPTPQPTPVRPPTPQPTPAPQVNNPAPAITIPDGYVPEITLSNVQYNTIFTSGTAPTSRKETLYTNRFIRYDLSGVNLGNHTQGFAILPNNQWAVSYSQNWSDAARPSYDNLSSLLITGGTNHFNINNVPARNSIELSGLAAAGNVVAAAWANETYFYYINPGANTFAQLTNLKLTSGNFVGFTKFNGSFYAVTGDDYKRGQFYRITRSIGSSSWGDPVSRGENRYRNNFIAGSASNFPETHVGAIALFSAGGKLFLGLMEYEVRAFALDRARNFVRLIEVKDFKGTPSYQVIRQFEVETDQAYDGPNFRWGGTMHISSRGELEIYSIARLFNEGNNGGLRIIKHTFKNPPPTVINPETGSQSLTSKTLIFSNESHYVVRYAVTLRTRAGNEQVWKSGELRNNESKPLTVPDDATNIVSIRMEYKDLLTWKMIDLIDYNKSAKDMPRRYILHGPILQKPKFRTSN